MDPNIKTENKTADPDKEAKYAEALVALSNMEMKMEQTQAPQKKRLMSKKKMVWIAITIVTTIISILTMPSLLKSDGSSDTKNKQTEQKLLDGADELKDLQNQ